MRDRDMRRALAYVATAQRQLAEAAEALRYLDDPYELAARRGSVTARAIA